MLVTRLETTSVATVSVAILLEVIIATEHFFHVVLLVLTVVVVAMIMITTNISEPRALAPFPGPLSLPQALDRTRKLSGQVGSVKDRQR